MNYHIPDYYIPGNYEVNFEIISPVVTPVEGEEPPPLTKQQDRFAVEFLHGTTGERLPYSGYLAEHIIEVDSISQFRRTTKKDRLGLPQSEEVIVAMRLNDSADGRVTAALQLLFELARFTVRVVHTDQARKPVSEVILSACTVYDIQHPRCDVRSIDSMITTLRVRTSAVSASALLAREQKASSSEESTTG